MDDVHIWDELLWLGTRSTDLTRSVAALALPHFSFRLVEHCQGHRPLGPRTVAGLSDCILLESYSLYLYT